MTTAPHSLADRLEKAIADIRDAPRRFFDLAKIIETSKTYDPIPFLRSSGERYTKCVAELAEILSALRSTTGARAREAKMLEALDLASGIMDSSRGDAYERACNQKDYDRFCELMDEIRPPEPISLSTIAEPAFSPGNTCPICARKLRACYNPTQQLKSHMRDVHGASPLASETHEEKSK